jgi:hypothetical protein
VRLKRSRRLVCCLLSRCKRRACPLLCLPQVSRHPFHVHALAIRHADSVTRSSVRLKAHVPDCLHVLPSSAAGYAVRLLQRSHDVAGIHTGSQQSASLRSARARMMTRADRDADLRATPPLKRSQDIHPALGRCRSQYVCHEIVPAHTSTSLLTRRRRGLFASL